MCENRTDALKIGVKLALLVMHLNDLEAFIRLPGRFPVTKVKLKYKLHPKISVPFIYENRDEKKSSKEG